LPPDGADSDGLAVGSGGGDGVGVVETSGVGCDSDGSAVGAADPDAAVGVTASGGPSTTVTVSLGDAMAVGLAGPAVAFCAGFPAGFGTRVTVGRDLAVEEDLGGRAEVPTEVWERVGPAAGGDVTNGAGGLVGLCSKSKAPKAEAVSIVAAAAEPPSIARRAPLPTMKGPMNTGRGRSGRNPCRSPGISSNMHQPQSSRTASRVEQGRTRCARIKI